MGTSGTMLERRHWTPWSRRHKHRVGVTLSHRLAVADDCGYFCGYPLYQTMCSGSTRSLGDRQVYPRERCSVLNGSIWCVWHCHNYEPGGRRFEFCRARQSFQGFFAPVVQWTPKLYLVLYLPPPRSSGFRGVGKSTGVSLFCSPDLFRSKNRERSRYIYISVPALQPPIFGFIRIQEMQSPWFTPTSWCKPTPHLGACHPPGSAAVTDTTHTGVLRTIHTHASGLRRVAPG